MATFTQALEWLKQGRKVHRETRRNGPEYIWSPSSIGIYTPEGDEYPFDFYDIEATDWQLYDDGQQFKLGGETPSPEALRLKTNETAVTAKLGDVSGSADTLLTTDISVSPSLAAKILKLVEKESKRKPRTRKRRKSR